MKISVQTVVALSVFLTSVLCHSVERIEQISTQLNTIFQCPERVWPGLKKDKFRILFVEPSTKKAWLWKGIDGTIDSIPESEFLPLVPSGSYSFIDDFRGSRTVVLDLDKKSAKPLQTTDDAVELGLHEGFHFLFQMYEPWVAASLAVQRNPNVDRIKAVYFRQMLIRALKRAVLEKGDLGQAAFWYLRWKETGESSDTRFSDVIEGTAHYIEKIGSVIASQGCEIEELNLIEQTNQGLLSAIAQNHPLEIRKILFAEYVKTGYQTESYEIGVLSLMALRMNGRKAGVSEFEMGRDYIKEFSSATDKMKVFRELEEAKARVRTPIELLLDTVEAVTDADDFTLLEQITESARP